MGGTRVVAGIQARMGSTRLPGKVLADLAGRPLIERVFERARACERIDSVLVLTSTDPSDDPLAAELEGRGIPFRRGPLADVLARYLALADELDPDLVVRITGDCPLIEPAFLDHQIAALEAFDADFAFVEGGGVEGTLGGQSALSARALRRAAESNDPRDREHVGSFYFAEHRDRFRFVGIRVDDALRREGLRLSVDEEADLFLARRIFERFAPASDGVFPLRDVLCWLDENPSVAALNRRVGESADNRALRAIARKTEPPLVGRWP